MSIESSFDEHAVVDHVAHEPPQLGVVRNRLHQLVEGDRIEDDVAAELVELERLVVEGGGAGGQGQHIFLGRLGVHGDQEVHLFLPSDVALVTGADGVPGRQAGDVRREHVLAADRHAHLKNGSEKDEVGGLTAGSVDGGDLDGEVVDDALGACALAGLLDGDVGHGHCSL